MALWKPDAKFYPAIVLDVHAGKFNSYEMSFVLKAFLSRFYRGGIFGWLQESTKVPPGMILLVIKTLYSTFTSAEN